MRTSKGSPSQIAHRVLHAILAFVVFANLELAVGADDEELNTEFGAAEEAPAETPDGKAPEKPAAYDESAAEQPEAPPLLTPKTPKGPLRHTETAAPSGHPSAGTETAADQLNWTKDLLSHVFVIPKESLDTQFGSKNDWLWNSIKDMQATSPTYDEIAKMLAKLTGRLNNKQLRRAKEQASIALIEHLRKSKPESWRTRFIDRILNGVYGYNSSPDASLAMCSSAATDFGLVDLKAPASLTTEFTKAWKDLSSAGKSAESLVTKLATHKDTAPDIQKKCVGVGNPLVKDAQKSEYDAFMAKFNPEADTVFTRNVRFRELVGKALAGSIAPDEMAELKTGWDLSDQVVWAQGQVAKPEPTFVPEPSAREFAGKVVVAVSKQLDSTPGKLRVDGHELSWTPGVVESAISNLETLAKAKGSPHLSRPVHYNTIEPVLAGAAAATAAAPTPVGGGVATATPSSTAGSTASSAPPVAPPTGPDRDTRLANSLQRQFFEVTERPPAFSKGFETIQSQCVGCHQKGGDGFDELPLDEFGSPLVKDRKTFIGKIKEMHEAVKAGRMPKASKSLSPEEKESLQTDFKKLVDHLNSLPPKP